MKSEVKFDVDKRNLIIRLDSELDHHNSEFVRKKADILMDIHSIKNVIFDFENVSFMDSSGIGVIMGRYKKAIFNKGGIKVVNVGDRVDKIMRMSGLYKIVTKYKDVNEALDSCM